jgi:hypothetical protein
MIELFTSLWIGNMTRMKNGTSDEISQIPILANEDRGIDGMIVNNIE